MSEVRLLFAGDVYAGDSDLHVAAEVQHLARQADLVIANLESPLTDDGEPLAVNKTLLRSSPKNIRVLRELSTDIACLANNHICDWDRRGLARTLDILAEKLASGQRVYLDLGQVRDVGEVFLNGRPLGIVWKRPFRVDLTPAARVGKNELIVKITNLWINRLSGDMVTKGKRYTRTNQQPLTWNHDEDAPWHEQTSGLLGPVKLLYVPGDGQVWADGGLPGLVVGPIESR